jgi:hypothetical protein
MNLQQEIFPFQHVVSDVVGLRLLTERQVGENMFIRLVYDTTLDIMGIKTVNRKQKTEMEFVQKQNQGKIYVNHEIMSAPDGVYTWILYKVDRRNILVSCPVQTILEYTNRHTIINYIAYKHGLIKNEDISMNIQSSSQKSYIYYAGEFKKNGDGLEFNFQSGTYSVPNKNELEKNLKFNKLLTNIEKKWCEHFMKCLDNFGFDMANMHYVDFENKTSPNSTFINFRNIPFIPENYTKLQPYIQGRWIFTDTKKNIVTLRKKISLFENQYMTWEGLIRIPKYKDEPKPTFTEQLPFLDRL